MDFVHTVIHGLDLGGLLLPELQPRRALRAHP